MPVLPSQIGFFTRRGISPDDWKNSASNYWNAETAANQTDSLESIHPARGMLDLVASHALPEIEEDDLGYVIQMNAVGGSTPSLNAPFNLVNDIGQANYGQYSVFCVMQFPDDEVNFNFSERFLTIGGFQFRLNYNTVFTPDFDLSRNVGFNSWFAFLLEVNFKNKTDKRLNIRLAGDFRNNVEKGNRIDLISFEMPLRIWLRDLAVFPTADIGESVRASLYAYCAAKGYIF